MFKKIVSIVVVVMMIAGMAAIAVHAADDGSAVGANSDDSAAIAAGSGDDSVGADDSGSADGTSERSSARFVNSADVSEALCSDFVFVQ